MRMLRGGKNSLSIKILISLFSLIFFIGLLEIGLRIAGYFYFVSKTARVEERNKAVDLSYKMPEFKNIKGVHTILCVGDSFTFGGEASSKTTYPAQLEKMLNDGQLGCKFTVVNKGVCEYNSRQLLRFLPRWLKIYNPDTVIILIGSSNRFNPWGYNLYAKQGLGQSLKNVICNLRIAKMVKLIILNIQGKPFYLKSRYILTEEDSDFTIDGFPKGLTRYDQAQDYFKVMEAIDSCSGQDAHRMLWYYYNKGDMEQMFQLSEKLLQREAVPIRILCDIAYMYNERGRPEQAARLYKKALENSTDREFVSFQLALFYRKRGEASLRQGQYDLAVENFLSAIRIDPMKRLNYYLMSKAYELQSSYDSDFVLNALQEMQLANPQLERNRGFMDYVIYFKNKRKWEAKIRQWLDEDLEKIVRLCLKKGTKVIIQNYPVSYHGANMALKEIASKYELPFVDNCSVFERIAPGERRKIYVTYDDHCTPEGYCIMAENTYGVLRKDIFSETK